MRWSILVSCLAVAACGVTDPSGGQMDNVRALISSNDIAMNRPDSDMREALFRMRSDGTGTVAFLNNPDGAQDVEWTLRGDRFCIQADEGLMASFECANLSVTGAEVTLAHTKSNSVVTGLFVAR